MPHDSCSGLVYFCWLKSVAFCRCEGAESSGVKAMFIRAFVSYCLLSIILSCPAGAKGPFGSIHLGQWVGGAYTNDTTGAFSHCAAQVPYNRGIVLLVGMRADRQWTLGFLRPAWKFTPGETIPIGLTFDGREQFNVFGEAQTIPGFVVVLMPQNSALLNQFRQKRTA